jgi:hypothetical protein
MRHAPAMFAHTFRGSTWRSALGLESSRAVFARYKAIRHAERQYLPSDDPGLGSRDPGFEGQMTVASGFSRTDGSVRL